MEPAAMLFRLPRKIPKYQAAANCHTIFTHIPRRSDMIFCMESDAKHAEEITTTHSPLIAASGTFLWGASVSYLVGATVLAAFGKFSRKLPFATEFRKELRDPVVTAVSVAAALPGAMSTFSRTKRSNARNIELDEERRAMKQVLVHESITMSPKPDAHAESHVARLDRENTADLSDSVGRAH